MDLIQGLVSRTPRISCVREPGTFLELVAIKKGAPYFHSVLLNGVNKHRPVTSTSTDVATSAKTSLFLIAVRGVKEKGGEEKKNKKGNTTELIKHNSQSGLQKLHQNR